jgi:methionyl aminopeptidase
LNLVERNPVKYDSYFTKSQSERSHYLMEENSLTIQDKYDRSGQITRDTRKRVESMDWRGKSYLEICEFAEGEIRHMGGEPAFPVNVCANESAAHYTAEIGDKTTVAQDALLKVDLGTHIDGYVTDTSVTICYNDSLFDLTEATKTSLNEAIKGVSLGVKTGDIGKIVEAYASRRGYIPIENLSGHSLDQYVVHAGSSVPNVWSVSNSTFRLNQVYAIEPFFTTSNGSGIVIEGRNRNIFSLVTRKRTKDARLDELLELIWKTRRTLPFAARWFSEYYSKEALDSMLSKMLKMRLVHAYPELLESKGTPIAQSEHTIRVTNTGPVVLT